MWFRVGTIGLIICAMLHFKQYNMRPAISPFKISEQASVSPTPLTSTTNEKDRHNNNWLFRKTNWVVRPRLRQSANRPSGQAARRPQATRPGLAAKRSPITKRPGLAARQLPARPPNPTSKRRSSLAARRSAIARVARRPGRPTSLLTLLVRRPPSPVVFYTNFKTPRINSQIT